MPRHARTLRARRDARPRPAVWERPSPPAVWKRLLPPLACLLLALAPPAVAAARGVKYDLPAGAVVVETRAVETRAARGGRTLILWMLNPTRHPRAWPEETYTCPEATRGSHYSGPTRVSLADARTGRVLNTVEVRDAHDAAADSFDIPFRIRAGGYYHVPGRRHGREGRPVVMQLKDYNGDGRAHEFALYDAWACMGLETTLIGYSERRDRVVQYPIHLTITGGQQASSVSPWADYLFSRRPARPGRWKYQIDYRGRGGSLDTYDVKYDREGERFEGSLAITNQP